MGNTSLAALSPRAHVPHYSGDPFHQAGCTTISFPSADAIMAPRVNRPLCDWFGQRQCLRHRCVPRPLPQKSNGYPFSSRQTKFLAPRVNERVYRRQGIGGLYDSRSRRDFARIMRRANGDSIRRRPAEKEVAKQRSAKWKTKLRSKKLMVR